MNVSKTLTAAVAAATIVGAVGFAYAQTTSDTAAAPATPSAEATQSPSAASMGTQMPAPGTQGAQLPTGQDATGNAQMAARDSITPKPTDSMPSAQSNRNSTLTDNNSSNASTMPSAPNDNALASNERQPKADRN